MDFSSIIDESARSYGDRVALTSADEALSFTDLADRTARLAGGFVELGLTPGDRLALLMPNCLELIVALLAAARAELIAVPIVARFAPPQIAFALKHSGARALVAAPTVWANVPSEARESLDHVVTTGPVPGALSFTELSAAAPIAPVRTMPDPIGLLMYTSGTTSRPKGVAHSQRRMTRRVRLFIEELELTAEDATVSTADAGRPAVLLGQVLPMLRVGGRTHLLSRPDPALFWDAYDAVRPSYLFTLPGTATDFLDHSAANRRDFSRLRFWITGGDKAPAALHDRMTTITGKPLLEMCGMTEAGFYAINPPGGPVKVGSIGLAMRGVAVRLAAPDGNDVPPGEVGHVFVRTPDLMIGYWNDTLLTHRVLQDGWLDTGDLAWADNDGYIWFVGRDKDMISRGGMKVAPAMVEAVLLGHPAPAECAVVGMADARYGQVPFAFYRLREGMSDPGADALRGWVAERLDAPSVPVGFSRVEKWPLTAQGKLDRARLAWMAEAGAEV
jgi:acyl-coenzyme A synthetase/AMP-(fatty) acid ligase